VEATLDLIDGQVEGGDSLYLLNDAVRFNELRRRLSRITQRMLTRQLRELEADGLIHREIHAEVPLRVEYSLTTLGRSLEPVVRMLWTWGNQYIAARRLHALSLDGAASPSQLAEHRR
jgi:DNA-binding HxlR family transcriptional regulator